MQAAKILVVDDDTVARDLLAEALKEEGYSVEAYGSGEEAIARGREGRVDLVLTDIRMGAVDGLTVLREFKRMSQDTAIVVLTAFGSLEGAIEALLVVAVRQDLRQHQASSDDQGERQGRQYRRSVAAGDPPEPPPPRREARRRAGPRVDQRRRLAGHR